MWFSFYVLFKKTKAKLLQTTEYQTMEKLKK